MSAIVERDFSFQAGVYFNKTVLFNLYDFTVQMEVETDDIREQNIAMDRIKYFIYECLEGVIFIQDSEDKNIEKLTDQVGFFTTTQTIQNGIALGGKAINAAASFLERKIGINFTQSDIWQTGKGFANAASANVDGKIGIRTIRRIADTVALYMPDTLAFSYNQQYDQLNPGREGLQALAASLGRGPGQAVDRRQRRRGRPLGLPRRDRDSRCRGA